MNSEHELEMLPALRRVPNAESVVFGKAWNLWLLRTAGVKMQDLVDSHHDSLIKAVTKIGQLRHQNAFNTWFRRVLKSSAKEYRAYYTNPHQPRKREQPKQIGTKWVDIDGKQYAVRVFEPYAPQEQTPSSVQRFALALARIIPGMLAKSSPPA